MFELVTKDDLFITKHAFDKMIIEGISVEQICQALEKGSRFTQTEGYLSIYTYFSVAWKKFKNKYKIKTVFLNK